jgi:hypothetical protein
VVPKHRRNLFVYRKFSRLRVVATAPQASLWLPSIAENELREVSASTRPTNRRLRPMVRSLLLYRFIPDAR